MRETKIPGTIIRGQAGTAGTAQAGAIRRADADARLVGVRRPYQILRVWAMSFMVWSIPAVAFTVLLSFVPENPEGSTILSVFLRQGLPWYYWAFVTPFILSLTSQLPMDRAPRIRNLMVHVWIGVMAGFFFGLIWLVILMVMPSPEGATIVTTRRLITSMAFFIPFGCGVYATLASIGYAMDFYRRLREREVHEAELQSQLREAQLGALRMQLQPHFLFNTLNTISMLVREGETQTSVRMLARLSDLLRHMLEDEGEAEVPIREELDFLGRYLEIEQIRFQDRLRVDMVVEEGTRNAFIPNLVLQPIVENAIRHGISSRAAASAIELRVARENGSLMLSVSDDGPGLSPTFSLDTITGIGLRNTIARLHHLYGDAASMDIRNAAGHGTVVTLRIPYHESPVSLPNG